MMTVDDSRLFKLFEALSPEQRKKALRGAVARAGTKVRKAALKNLRQSFRVSRELEKQLRRISYKNVLGFRLTVAGSGKTDLPPVLMWGETGTAKRFTRTKSRIFRRKRRGHYTGVMPRYGFLGKTRDEEGPKVTETLRTEIIKNIERTAKRYGCTVS